MEVATILHWRNTHLLGDNKPLGSSGVDKIGANRETTLERKLAALVSLRVKNKHVSWLSLSNRQLESLLTS